MCKQIKCLAEACVMQTKTVMSLEAKIEELEKQNADLRKELFNIREVLNIQEDKNCLGTGYPINKNECAPWPIVDEIINRITQTLKDGE